MKTDRRDKASRNRSNGEDGARPCWFPILADDHFARSATQTATTEEEEKRQGHSHAYPHPPSSKLASGGALLSGSTVCASRSALPLAKLASWYAIDNQFRSYMLRGGIKSITI